MNHLDRLPEIAASYHTARTLNPENPLGTHDYMPVYQRLLRDRPIRKILEIGLGPAGLFHKDQPAGCGLLMWQDVFPKAKIFGLDIRPDTLINKGNIRSFLCDQSKEDELLEVAPLLGVDEAIDFIVDDGSHRPMDQVLTARVFVPWLSPNGLYVIEDVLPDGECSRNLPFAHEVIELRTDVLVDDRLIVIEARNL